MILLPRSRELGYLTILSVFLLSGCLSSQENSTNAFSVEVASDDPVQAYAVRKLQEAYELLDDQPLASVYFELVDTIAEESYHTQVTQADGQLTVRIQGGDERGLLYGSMDLIEQLRLHPDAVESRSESARFPFRAIKFNLPYVSYRAGKAIDVHLETCRDLKFWEAFLDMMVENRFNSLTLWSLHPFHLMIRNTDYPEACDLTDAELADWQVFWRSLFAMAAERGIDTYLVNWNIFVSPAFAEHHEVAEYSSLASKSHIGEGDSSELIVAYTRSTVTQVLDTYPNLTGLGVSLGERMGGFTPDQREQWILDTFVAGIRDAKRPARFIHRLPFSANKGSGGSASADTELMTRQAIESIGFPETILTEAKFNWSHSHSTPKLIKVHGGKLGDTYWNPPPTNYQMHWMIRNEDFFALRWCEPDFIRSHIEQNGQEYVGGYYLGSECYIPATDYITIPERATGYAFERQWLYYMAWGRLLYDPELDDQFLVDACRQRYGEKGEDLFQALKLGSRMPLKLASFYNATWDFTLYSEGFQSIQAKSNPDRLITVEELIKRSPLEPDYLSIREFVKMEQSGENVPESRVTPLELADLLERDGDQALKLIRSLGEVDGKGEKAEKAGLDLELADAEAWAHLSLYFADKLRAAVALHLFRETRSEEGLQAISHLKKANLHWQELSEVTSKTHRIMPLVQVFPYKHAGEDTRTFHWKNLLPAIQAELEKVTAEVQER